MRNCCWSRMKCCMWTDRMRHSPTWRLSRRQMLHRLSAGFGLLGLASLLGPASAAAAAASNTTRAAHFRPRAKRIIFLFMNGGPSHVDTFDPKPALQAHQGEQPGGDLFKKSKGAGFMPSPLQFHRYGQ